MTTSTLEDRILATITPSTRHRGPESRARIVASEALYRLAAPLRRWLGHRWMVRYCAQHPPRVELRTRTRTR